LGIITKQNSDGNGRWGLPNVVGTRATSIVDHVAIAQRAPELAVDGREDIGAADIRRGRELLYH
jgi:hypothetical protein